MFHALVYTFMARQVVGFSFTSVQGPELSNLPRKRFGRQPDNGLAGHHTFSAAAPAVVNWSEHLPDPWTKVSFSGLIHW